MLPCMCLGFSLLAFKAGAYTGNTWDPQGTGAGAPTGGTWESASWSTSTTEAGQATPVNFVESEAACFAFGALGGSASTFTITMNSSHTVAGLFNGPLNPKSCYVTINGPGSMIIPGTAAQGINTGGSTLGQTTINAVISGVGAIIEPEGAGSLYLYGANTYSGGTILDQTGIIYFTNGAAFGSGPISIAITGGALVNNATSAVLITNTFTGGTYNLNIVPGSGGTTFSGPWSLGATSPTIGAGSTAGWVLTISGAITGTGNFNKYNSGTMILTGVNTYSGSTSNGGPFTISGAGQLGSGSYAGKITNSGTFTYASSASQTFSGIMSGTGALVESGPGKLTLTAANTYTGTTTVGGGILALGTGGSIGGSAVTVSSGGTLANATTTTRTIGGNTTLSSGGFASFTATGPGTVGKISVTGNLALSGNAITVNVSGSSLAAGIYRLMDCTSTLSGSANLTPTITGTALTPGLTASVTNTTGAAGHFDLVISKSTPTFSGLTASQSIIYGTTSITLGGNVSAGSASPAIGDTVTVTINGNAQGTTTTDGSGDFSFSYNPHAIPASGTPYTITYSYAGNGVLNAASDTSTALTVNQATLGITANSGSKPYGQTNTYGAGSTAFTSVGLVNSEMIGSVTLTCSGGAGNAPVSGSPYTITPSLASGGTFNANNYSITYNAGSLTVLPTSLTVTANTNRFYGVTNPVFTATYTGFVNGETLATSDLGGSPDLSSTADTNSVVGDYVITVGSGTLTSTNYSLAFVDGDLTVTNEPLTVTADTLSNVYGAPIPALTYTFGGLVNGDSATDTNVLTGAPVLSTAATSGSSVVGGPYAIVVANGTLTLVNTNYVLVLVNGNLGVTPADLTVTASDESKTYGQTLIFGSGSTLFTSSGLQNSDAIDSVTLAVNGGDVGSAPASGSPYTITPSAATGVAFAASNYNITYNTGSLTVGQALLSITANNDSKSYGQTKAYGAGSTAFGSIGLQNGEAIGTVTITASGGAAAADPLGSYTLTPSAAMGGTFTAGNYNITYNAGTLTVGTATITVTADNFIRFYGVTNPVFTASYSGFVNGQTLGTSDVGGSPSLTCSADTNSTVGDYVITATLGTLTSTNYSFAFVNGDLTVTNEPLTVTADTLSNVYGAPIPTLTYTFGGLVNGDSATDTNVLTGAPSLSTAATSGSSVVGSPYAIVVADGTLTLVNTNYVLVLVDGNLGVTPANLTVTASDENKTYGQTLTFGSGSTLFTSSGLQNSDAIDTVTLSVSGGDVAGAPVSGSPYTITPSAATGVAFAASNYNITYSPGALTVGQAALSITANNDSKTYGQAKTYGAGSTAFSNSALQNGEAIGTVTLACSGGAANAPVSGSPYAITPSAATGGTFAAANYNITYNAGTLTVSPLAVNLSGTRAFDGTATAAAAILSVANPVGSDVVTVAGGSATLASTNVGPQSITSFASLTLGGAAAGNYTLTGASGSVTITAPLSISITSQYVDSTGTNFIITWTSAPGSIYHVIGTNNSAAPLSTWPTVAGPITATGTSTSVTNAMTLPTEFFDVVSP